MKINGILLAAALVAFGLASGCGDNVSSIVSVADKDVIYAEHVTDGLNSNVKSYAASTNSMVNVDKREVILTCPCFLTNGYNSIGSIVLAPENKMVLALPQNKTYRITIWKKNEKHIYGFPAVEAAKS